MAEVKILIVEDDSFIAEEIAGILKGAGYRVTAVAESCEQTLQAVNQEAPDLIFMDIMISGKEDGIETALRLKELGSYPVIFLTNLHDKPTLERAHAAKPANYLAKPFTAHQLLVSIEHALLNFSENKEATVTLQESLNQDIIPIMDAVFIKDKHGFTKVQIADILYIEAGRAYCTIYTESGKFVQSNSMSHVKEQLNHPSLVQAERSHVVNIHRIQRIKGNMLVIAGNEIKMGDQYRDNVLKHLNLVR